MWIIILFFIPVSIWYYYYKRLKNPYDVCLYFGKKGSGKSTLIAKQMDYYVKHPYHRYYDYREKKWHKEKWHLYSNIIIDGYAGKYQLYDLKNLGTKFIPLSPSIVWADEINLVWDNRNWKAFKQGTQDLLRFNRRYRCCLRLFSQSYDCDLKVRTLTTKMVLLTNFLTIFTLERDIKKWIAVSENKDTAENQIVDRIDFYPLIQLLGHYRLTFLPHWINKQQSYIHVNDEMNALREYNETIEERIEKVKIEKTKEEEIPDIFKR